MSRLGGLDARQTTRRDLRSKPYLLTSEVAQVLHASPKTVGTWAMQGKLPYQRTLGGHRRYPTEPILALAATLSVGLHARPSASRAVARREAP